ncbi:hypothetical protein Q7689_00285 [Nocardiopsis tropica]|uniref:hypothetical protein n=1 Tax=Nocardiopsis tropica TaxID=109330 RepID=UPI002E8D8000|nr:hypothetical protein [Nocardiopsis tropica]
MTAARKPAAKKTSAPAGAIAVADLPDNKGAQISEAMEQDATFVMGDGTAFTFKPLSEWPYKANVAFAVGDIMAWAKGALADSSQMDDFLDHSSREVGRVIRYFDDMAGATRGEGSSSSQS